MEINDQKYGKAPFVVDIENATLQNETYRTLFGQAKNYK